jgi:hypothetical protein
VDNNVNVTILWLDIEGAEYWLGDAGQNQVHFLRFEPSFAIVHKRVRHGMRNFLMHVLP